MDESVLLDYNKRFNVILYNLLGEGKSKYKYETSKANDNLIIIPPSITNFMRPKSAEELKLEKMMTGCTAKCVISFFMGGGIGAIFGLFTSAVDPNMNPNHYGKTNITITAKDVLKDMYTRSKTYAKNFAILGAMYSIIECNVESYRAKTDWKNAAISGGLTGGILGFRAGYKAGLLGALGFGIFSTAIECYLR